MYEIWVDNEDPTRHLVVKSGAPKPTFFDERLWSRLGDVKSVSPWLSQEVEGCGFTTVTRLDVSFDAEREFG